MLVRESSAPSGVARTKSTSRMTLILIVAMK
jgi:hypothetical protein